MLFHRERGGFTLIEAMIAMVILGLVLLGALTAVRADLQASRLSAERLIMAQLAAEVVNQITVTSSEEFAAVMEGHRGAFPSPLNDYQWEARGSQLTEDGVIRVDVRVFKEQNAFAIFTFRGRNPGSLLRNDVR